MMDQEGMQPRKILRIIVLVFVFILLVTIVDNSIRAIQHRGMAKVDLQVVPSDSVLTIDGKTTSNHKTAYVIPGKHIFSATKQGFKTDTQAIVAKLHQKNPVNLTPTPTGAAGLAWAAKHPDDEQKRESLAQVAQNKLQVDQHQNYPLLQYLPKNGYHYYISYGASVKYPDEPSKVAIYISAIPDHRQMAIDWIKSLGYNPANYEIVYQNP